MRSGPSSSTRWRCSARPAKRFAPETAVPRGGGEGAGDCFAAWATADGWPFNRFLLGHLGQLDDLAAMPRLEEYGVPMVVEMSSASTITKRGNPWIFRISPPSEMEALGLEKYLKDLGVKRADFLGLNSDC